MKLKRLLILPFNQFGLLDLDLTYRTGPKKGQPLDKVCFIGENGTGKSTLLELIADAVNPNNKDIANREQLINKTMGITFFSELVQDEKVYEIVKLTEYKIRGGSYDETGDLNPFAEYTFGFEFNLDFKKKPLDILGDRSKSFRTLTLEPNFQKFDFLNKNDLLLYFPPESLENQFLKNNFNQTNLKESIQLFKSFSNNQIISNDHVQNFWKMLNYFTANRRFEREKFEESPENLNKTKKQLIEEFENKSPDFLKILNQEWEPILDKLGLYFDYESAKVPRLSEENLEVFIKSKEFDRIINYKFLSTGVRNLIFKLGYLKALYFNREIRSAIALIDEPENSLFPNLLFDLVSHYQRIAVNTQLFFSTHSPIIAAQFHPDERFILKFENSKVVATRGNAPEGDDPNDVLIRDFGLTSVLGPKGKEQFERYMELKALIKSINNDNPEKDRLEEEYLEIRRLYKF